MCRFPEFYMERKWVAPIVFHMVMKPLIQKKLSFREIGKNTGKPNGKLKSKCRKTEFLRLRQQYRFESCSRKSGWRKWYCSVSKFLFEFLPCLKLIDAVKKSSFDSTLKKDSF